MNQYRRVVLILLGLFIVVNGMYLHRVPGLLGDEGSEGENVYELLQREGITITGERSYIGPAIDYLRVPFIALFGYTTLAIRLPVFLFSIATFLLAASVLRRSFGDIPALFVLTLFSFSPVYILYQRIGWTITLFPFFAFLILFLLQRPWQSKWLWAGLAAGLGLANHIIFLPTLIGLAAGIAVWLVVQAFKTSSQNAKSPLYRLQITSYRLLLAFIGFWAGFAMQFAILQLETEDQGDPSATTQLFSERVNDFIDAAPLYLSGSSYVARYTGVEFAPITQSGIVGVLLLLGLIGIALNWKKVAVWAWAFGIHIQLFAALYIIDRFTLRYFVVYSLAMWLLAGLGLGSLLKKLPAAQAFSVVFALILTGWITVVTLIPFLQTGGSTSEFDLGNRTDSAAAFVDIRPLIQCLHGKGSVFSESVHIWNRLQYLSHSDEELSVVPEESKKEAQILIEYRDKNNPQPGQICPELVHFRVNGA